MAHGRRRARRAASGHARHAMPSIPRYETRTAQGSPGPAAAVGPRRRPGTRLRGDQRAARAQRPGVHPAGGNRLPSPAPARGGGPAAQLLGRAGRQAPAALRAHRQGRGGPAGTPRRVAPLLDRHPGRGRGTGVTADLIERYLDRLLTQLRGSAHDVRRILSETEDHLRDAASELMAAGASEEEAQRQAIARFGDARAVARRFSTRLAPIPPVAVAAELARTAVLLGAVGLVAIGASGALAELLGRAFGARFVAGDLPDVTYTPQRCAEFLEYFPNAGAARRPPRSTTGARWWSTGWRPACWGCSSSARSRCGAVAGAGGRRSTWASCRTGSPRRWRPACTAWPPRSWGCRAWSRSWSRAAPVTASGSAARSWPWRWRWRTARRCTAPCWPAPRSARAAPRPTRRNAPSRSPSGLGCLRWGGEPRGRVAERAQGLQLQPEQHPPDHQERHHPTGHRHGAWRLGGLQAQHDHGRRQGRVHGRHDGRRVDRSE